MEDNVLNLAYVEADKELAETVASTLHKFGYQTKVSKESVDPSHVTLLFLSLKTTAKSLLRQLRWLKEQLAFSSIQGFRLMPFIPYHAAIEDIDELWEAHIGEVYEEIFSGEFKPYGWDLDDESTINEFRRILEEYSE